VLVLFILLYIALTIGISLYAHSRINSANDFISAGRSLPTYINSAAFFALWFGSETIFGASSEFVDGGLRAVIEDPFGGVLCLLLVGLVFAKKLYNLNIFTIGDVFHKRMGREVEVMASAMMIVSFFGYAAAQIVALGLLFSTIFPSIGLNAGIIISAIIVIFYIFKGGMLAVTLNDFVQSFFIIIGLVAIAFTVTDMAGGYKAIFNSIPEDHFKFLPEKDPVSTINWFGAWMVLGFGSIVSQDIFQRVNSSKSAEVARKSTLYGALLYGIFAFLPLYIVSAVRVIKPEVLEGDLQLALPSMVIGSMPVGLQVLFFGSLISAIMSTCSGALLAPATLLSENILSNKDKETNLLDKTKVSIIVVGTISTLLAFSSQNIFELVSESSVFGLVSIFVPFCALLFTKYNSKVGVILSMLAGTLVWVYCAFIKETVITPLLFGVLASMVGLVVGVVIDRIAGEGETEVPTSER
jgi:solute:Na+ symporter, SSS family